MNTRNGNINTASLYPGPKNKIIISLKAINSMDPNSIINDTILLIFLKKSVSFSSFE